MIEVRVGRLGKSLVATQPLERGAVVLQGWGTLGRERTRHSIQVDRETHLTVDGPIQFINHSCDPNCGFLIRRGVDVLQVHVLQPIEPGEELTVDYATFEDEIAHMSAEACLCGADACRGTITGYGDLPADRRAAYGPYVAEHLRELDAPVHRAG